MKRRAALLAAVGLLAGSAVTLTVAAPAQAVVLNYYDYAQTLPASVIDTIPDGDERTAWTNGTRSGVTTTPKAPLPSGTFTRSGGGTAIFGAVGTVGAIIDGATHVAIQYDRSGERPSYIPQEEWDACALSGGDDWIGNIFDGLRDWTASLNGTDCNDVRAGWKVPIDPAYEPTNVGAGATGYPQKVEAANSPTYATFLSPVWSATPRTLGGVTKPEGWVYPIKFEGANRAILQVAQLTSSGSLVPYTTTTTVNAASIAGTGPGQLGSVSTDPACTTLSNGCFVPAVVSSGAPSGVGWANGTIVLTQARVCELASGSFTCTLAPGENLDVQPYVARDGVASPTPPGALDVVLMTTVKTAAGHSFTCTTAPFKETDPAAPAPCSPVVPEWEIETERITELVPLKDVPTYVPTTSPSKEIQKITTPQPLRDWEENFPDCQERVCKLFLMTILDDGTELNCMDDPTKCVDWSTRTDKATKFKCYYDGVAVALTECSKYARLFQPGALETGTAYPAPAPSPGQQTSTVPGGSTPPGSAPASPEGSRTCWPTGWGMLNPVEWVLQPVKCALEWAFVPRQSYVNSIIGGMKAKWTGSSLVSLLAVLEEGSHLVLNASGCDGPAIVLDIYGSHYSGHPLSACSQPMRGAADFAFAFTGIAAWVMAVASIARSIAGVVAFRGVGGDNA